MTGKPKKKRGKRTTKNSTTSPREIERAQKVSDALAYRKQGFSFEVIAETMGFKSPSAAYDLVIEGITALKTENAEQVKQLELERLNDMLTGLMPRVLTGDERAIDSMLRVMQFRARLLGLEAPIKVDGKHEHSGAGGGPINISITPDEAAV